jgi:hypothetical protein
MRSTINQKTEFDFKRITDKMLELIKEEKILTI